MIGPGHERPQVSISIGGIAENDEQVDEGDEDEQEEDADVEEEEVGDNEEDDVFGFKSTGRWRVKPPINEAT